MIIQTSTPQQIISLDQEKKKGIVLIWFYATWCGHCVDMESEWEKLSNNSPKGLKLAKIESSNMDNYKKSPGEEELRGFPTLRLYSKGGTLIKEYDGERSYQGIYDFANDYLKKHNNFTKNNLLMVKASRGNNINKKLINKIISNKKKTNKMKKKTVKNKKTNKKTKKKKYIPKKKRRQAGGHAKHGYKVEI